MIRTKTTQSDVLVTFFVSTNVSRDEVTKAGPESLGMKEKRREFTSRTCASYGALQAQNK